MQWQNIKRMSCKGKKLLQFCSTILIRISKRMYINEWQSYEKEK